MPTIENFTLPLLERPRRNRLSESIRRLVQETHLLPQHLVSPFFVIEGTQERQAIPSMPEVERLSIDLLLHEIQLHQDMGIQAIDLFTYIPHEKRDRLGSEAYKSDSLMQKAIYAVKKRFPDLCVMVDIALDPYTNHGHDGVIDEMGFVMNDLSVQLLGEMSLKAAEAGADILAPSDMMDGRIKYIRQLLDQNDYHQVGLLSYAAKYVTGMYAPFREALESAPRIGDKKTYQLNPANKREAIRDALLDVEEGADMLLVKPGLTNLDIISELRAKTLLPIAAYHVSGEYAMVMAAHERGWMDAAKIFYEHLLCLRRAGADFILTYATKYVFGQK